MSDFISRMPRLRQILLLVGGFLLLGALAWGIGWMTHGLIHRQATPLPTETLERATPSPTIVYSPTALSAPPPTVAPTELPTSISMPATSTAAPTVVRRVETFSVAASDRGLYDVVRRACGLTMDYTLVPSNEIVQETWRLNGFVEANPRIHKGQDILVPIYLCP
jgi:hypothetical protein